METDRAVCSRFDVQCRNASSEAELMETFPRAVAWQSASGSQRFFGSGINGNSYGTGFAISWQRRNASSEAELMETRSPIVQMTTKARRNASSEAELMETHFVALSRVCSDWSQRFFGSGINGNVCSGYDDKGFISRNASSEAELMETDTSSSTLWH